MNSTPYMNSPIGSIPPGYINLQQVQEQTGARANVCRKHRCPKWETEGNAVKDERGVWWINPAVIAELKPTLPRAEPVPAPPPPKTAAATMERLTLESIDRTEAKSAERWNRIERIAQEVRGTKQLILDQEDHITEARARWSDEKEKLTALQNTLAELQEEIDLLALGGHSERLPFGEKARTA